MSCGFKQVTVPVRSETFIVFCAANNYDGIRLADQHMADQLRVLHQVLYVDPPLSHISARRSIESARSLDGPRLRTIAPGLTRFTPVVAPFHSRPWMRRVTELTVRYLLRKAVRAIGGDVRAVISAWPAYDVFGSCDKGVRVYWAQDDFVGGAKLLGVNPSMLDRSERRVAANADLVVTSSPLVQDEWQHRGFDPVLIPFGVDAKAYADIERAPRPADVTLKTPVAGFIGHINARIGVDLLEAVVDRDISLLLVGPLHVASRGSRWERLLRKPNVQWVGPKLFAELPAYMNIIDVGLVPYVDSAFNRGSFPLKTLEYLAAGRPVVSTGLPATRWLSTQLIAIADTPRDFADAVAQAVSQSRSPAEIAARRAFATRHDYAGRARAMDLAIDTVAERLSHHDQEQSHSRRIDIDVYERR